MFTVTFVRGGEVHQWLYGENQFIHAKKTARILSDRFKVNVVVAHLIHKTKFYDKSGNTFFAFPSKEVESFIGNVHNVIDESNRFVANNFDQREEHAHLNQMPGLKCVKRPSVLIKRRSKRRNKNIDYAKLIERASFGLPLHEEQHIEKVI